MGYEIRKEQTCFGFGSDIKAIYDDDGSYVGEIRKEQTCFGFGTDIESVYLESYDGEDSKDKDTLSISEFKSRLCSHIRKRNEFDASQKQKMIGFVKNRKYDQDCACLICKSYKEFCDEHGYNSYDDENSDDDEESEDKGSYRQSDSKMHPLEKIVVGGIIAVGLLALLGACCSSNRR